MNKTQDIKIEAYDYPLPDEKIAKFPLSRRDESKLLVYRGGQISETRFKEIAGLLPTDSLLVFNNTKVIQARLLFRKETGAQIEVFCLEPKDPNDYVLAFQARRSCTWLCMIGNAKKWKEGSIRTPDGKLAAERLENYGDTHLVRFSWEDDSLRFADLLEQLGELPIPPYLNRKTEESDKETYQTIYSKIQGSVAAPTAGLHFTESVFRQLAEKQIDREELTLHVGAGTFKPVKAESIADHEMHVELIAVRRETIEQLLQKPDRILAVGTTSVRSLESLYYIGVLLEENAQAESFTIEQWMPYDEANNRIPAEKALRNILVYLDGKGLDVITAHTRIMIAPGYRFKLVSGIVTNFHQPKSTLLLLISAFVGEDWTAIYRYALEHDFRFLSYGDSSLLLR